MQTKFRRENEFIERFLSKYEGGSWAEAEIEWLDKLTEGAVEARARRRSDGMSVAIEHTIVEPFTGEKEDLARFGAIIPQDRK